MLIDCSHCQARVNADTLEVADYSAQEWPDSYQLALLRCPECKHLLVGEQALLNCGSGDSFWDENEKVWSDASRVWPEPTPQLLASSIPETIRICLLEARKCLFEGLKELHEKGVIDKRLYEWGDELRKHRNLAAHASGANFNLVDAKDLYEFSTAICEYVFVLTAKFQAFKKRQIIQEPQP